MTTDLDTVLSRIDKLEEMAVNDDAAGDVQLVGRAVDIAHALIQQADSEYGVPRVSDGEPVFVLVGRDPAFAPLAEGWAYLRSGRILQAKQAMLGIYDACTVLMPLPAGNPQVSSAFRAALKATEYQQRSALRGTA